MTLSPPTAVSIRKAVFTDRDAVAELDIPSMQRTYRPFLSEKYLTQEMPAQRRARWAERFASDLEPNYIVRVAKDDADTLVGFVCLVLDSADRWGILIDGLHVSVRHQRQGLGQRLLTAAVVDLDTRRANMPVHLLAYEANSGARGLHDALGSKIAERLTRNLGIRYVWESRTALLDALHRRRKTALSQTLR